MKIQKIPCTLWFNNYKLQCFTLYPDSKYNPHTTSKAGGMWGSTPQGCRVREKATIGGGFFLSKQDIRNIVMNLKTIGLCFLFFFLLIISLWPDISVSPSGWDCGSVDDSRVLSKEVTITNGGTQQATVEIMETCDCFYAGQRELSLTPGSKRRIILYFNPSGEEGTVEKLLIIENKNTQQNKILFTLHALVIKSATKKADPGKGETEPTTSATSGKTISGEIPAPVRESAEASSALPQEASESPKEITVYFYYSFGCKSCERLLDSFFPTSAEKLAVTLDIVRQDILSAQVMEEYQATLQRLGFPMRQFPALIVGTTVLQGEDEIRSGFAEAVEKTLTEPGVTAETAAQTPGSFDDTATLPPERDVLPNFFFLLVLTAGLADGINPCAFSTLIFLVVSLAYVGKSRRAILLTGIFFTLAIFVTYYLLGLIGTGFLSFLRHLPYAPLIALIVRIIFIILLFVFACLSIYDFILIRRGRAGEMVLQLPKKIKQRIHRSVRAYVSSIALVSGAIILGFYVSVFELACTGQIYFPVIAALAQLKSHFSAYFYLVLYNVGFIIPLVGVFIFVYLGTSSEKITALFQKHMGLVKIVLAGVFIALAVIMILT